MDAAGVTLSRPGLPRSPAHAALSVTSGCHYRPGFCGCRCSPSSSLQVDRGVGLAAPLPPDPRPGALSSPGLATALGARTEGTGPAATGPEAGQGAQTPPGDALHQQPLGLKVEELPPRLPLRSEPLGPCPFPPERSGRGHTLRASQASAPVAEQPDGRAPSGQAGARSSEHLTLYPANTHWALTVRPPQAPGDRTWASPGREPAPRRVHVTTPEAGGRSVRGGSLSCSRGCAPEETLCRGRELGGSRPGRALLTSCCTRKEMRPRRARPADSWSWLSLQTS